MPITCKFKPLPPEHGDQIIEMWVVCRDDGEEQVEIAEHPDGAMKAYASEKLAERARRELAISGEADGKRPWRVETIWLLHKGEKLSVKMARDNPGMFSEEALRNLDEIDVAFKGWHAPIR